MPWDPWLPRCTKNLTRSCQDSQDASKRVNPGYHDQFGIKYDSVYGQPGTINFYGPEYDQPGIKLSLLWQSMVSLFLYGKETRVGK